MEQIAARIQQALAESSAPAWLFYGFRDQEPLASRILGFAPDAHFTRRWFYLVPAAGHPIKLVHRIESGVLDHLEGEKKLYLSWQELTAQLKELLKGFPEVAMQYSPKNAIPYVSRIDAGTAELVEDCGARLLSSGDLVQRVEAVWTPKQIDQHRDTAQMLARIVQAAYRKAYQDISSGRPCSELAVQVFILEQFERHGLETDSAPIVACNENSSNPHYQPHGEISAPLRPNDFLLIDAWAKPASAHSVYADITWTAFLGERPPKEMARLFRLVRQARDQGVRFLQECRQRGRFCQGWEVDDAVRAVIDAAGFGAQFIHRTGHNLGREVHGNGVNFDNLEAHDTRQVLPGTCNTIEPGVYLDRFGIRSEINVCVLEDRVEVTTPRQQELLSFSAVDGAVQGRILASGHLPS